MPFTLEPLVKRERNMRLADTRLPGEHHHPAFALRDLFPPSQQELYLLFASEQRRQLGLVHCFEAALHATRPQHLRNRYRLRPTFQRERAEIKVVEMPPTESACTRANQHGPPLPHSLQPRAAA